MNFQPLRLIGCSRIESGRRVTLVSSQKNKPDVRELVVGLSAHELSTTQVDWSSRIVSVSSGTGVAEGQTRCQGIGCGAECTQAFNHPG